MIFWVRPFLHSIWFVLLYPTASQLSQIGLSGNPDIVVFVFFGIPVRFNCLDTSDRLVKIPSVFHSLTSINFKRSTQGKNVRSGCFLDWFKNAVSENLYRIGRLNSLAYYVPEGRINKMKFCLLTPEKYKIILSNPNLNYGDLYAHIEMSASIIFF